MSFDLFAEIEKATQQWRLAHNLEPQVKYGSITKPGGVSIIDGLRIYTREKVYHWGSEWIAFEDTNSGCLDGPVGKGRTEAEAVEDLKEQL